jgi:small subunit ribosomal protein S18
MLFSSQFNTISVTLMDKPTDKPRSKTPEDYTVFDVEVLTRHVTDTGKILPRRITQFTAKQQRHVTKTIKRARSMLLMK